MQATLTRSPALAAHPSVRRPPGLGEEVEAGIGGDLDPSPSQPATPKLPPSSLLSVADLQYALRVARGARYPHSPGRELPDSAATRWLPVIAAHSGAGASTVALAVAEAATVQHAHEVHLVEYAADPGCSGLAAAAVTEHGVDATGAWRRGRRAGVIMHRRSQPADSAAPAGELRPGAAWPTSLTDPTPATRRLVVLDLATAPDGPNLPAAGAVLVVFRTTVPGARAVETLLERLERTGDSAARVVAAAVGPRHWPGAVTAGIGRRLADLGEHNRIVTVPTDRALAITGATADPLPKSLLTAGRALLDVLMPVAPAGAGLCLFTTESQR